MGRGTLPGADVLPYIIAQVAGGVAGAAVLLLIASGAPRFDVGAGFAANGYAEHSPGQYSLVARLLAQIVLTFMFLLIVQGATDERAPQGFGPLAIGLGLTLIHLIGIPITNLSVNPARSTGPALIAGGWALAQLWLFWVAPLGGAVLSGAAYRWLSAPQSTRPSRPTRSVKARTAGSCSAAASPGVMRQNSPICRCRPTAAGLPGRERLSDNPRVARGISGLVRPGRSATCGRNVWGEPPIITDRLAGRKTTNTR